jgi:hypothetical protein
MKQVGVLHSGLLVQRNRLIVENGPYQLLNETHHLSLKTYRVSGVAATRLTPDNSC